MRSWIPAGAAALLLASACGGGGSPGGPSGSPSPGAVRTVLIEGTSFTVGPRSSSFTNIDFPPTGTIDVSANWAGSNTVEVYATSASCAGFEDVAAGRCPVLGKAEGTAKPKQFTFPSQSGNVYTIWTANRGGGQETVALTAGVTTSGPVVLPAPAPAPSAVPDPRDGWAPGPVTQVKAYLKTIETSKGNRDYRPGEQDADGFWILYVGEYVVIDSTQRNGAGQICRWIDDPVYDYRNSENIMDVTGSSEPFFLKFNVDRPGTAEVWSTIDGIQSNVLKLKAVRD